MAMYVVCHKKVNRFKIREYRYIQAGSINGVHLEGMLHDDTGDHISDKNPSFCEMTAIYWIWKNRKDPYVGISHYRRLFSNKWSDKEVLSWTDALKLLNRYDIILPQIAFLPRSIADQYCMNDGTPADLQILRVILKEKSPDYLETYDHYMKGRQTCYLNMMISRREVLDAYCGWIFPILFEMEKRVDLSVREGNQKRIFGYLAELLLNVWVRYQRLKCAHIFIIETERNPGKPLKLVYRFARTITYRFELFRGRVSSFQKASIQEEAETGTRVLVYAATARKLGTLPEYVVPVETGSALRTDHIDGYDRDDAEDHISEKNRSYCELTVLYRLWRNKEAEIKGLCHYRRFFSSSGVKRLYPTGLIRIRDLRKETVSRTDIVDYLKQYDIILPMPYSPATETVQENLEKYVYSQDIRKMGELIRELWPAYEPAWEKALQKKHISYYNMLIAGSKIFNSYCEWLFAVLQEAEQRMDISRYDSDHVRLFGYVAEILLNVWADTGHLRVKYLNVDQVLEYSGKNLSEKAVNYLYYCIQQIIRFKPVGYLYKVYCRERYPELFAFYAREDYFEPVSR